PTIGDLLAQRLRVLMLGRRGIQGIRDSVAFAFAEMIDQQVAGNGRDPGHERALARIVGIQGAVHLDKDLLSEILRVAGIAGKAVADVVNPPVIALNDFFPSRGIAPNAATDEQSDNLGFFQNQTPRVSCSPPQTFGRCRSEVRGRLTRHARYVSVEREVSFYL